MTSLSFRICASSSSVVLGGIVTVTLSSDFTKAYMSLATLIPKTDSAMEEISTKTI